MKKILLVSVMFLAAACSNRTSGLITTNGPAPIPTATPTPAPIAFLVQEKSGPDSSFAELSSLKNGVLTKLDQGDSGAYVGMRQVERSVVVLKSVSGINAPVILKVSESSVVEIPSPENTQGISLLGAAGKNMILSITTNTVVIDEDGNQNNTQASYLYSLQENNELVKISSLYLNPRSNYPVEANGLVYVAVGSPEFVKQSTDPDNQPNQASLGLISDGTVAGTRGIYSEALPENGFINGNMSADSSGNVYFAGQMQNERTIYIHKVIPQGVATSLFEDQMPSSSSTLQMKVTDSRIFVGGGNFGTHAYQFDGTDFSISWPNPFLMNSVAVGENVFFIASRSARDKGFIISNGSSQSDVLLSRGLDENAKIISVEGKVYFVFGTSLLRVNPATEEDPASSTSLLEFQDGSVTIEKVGSKIMILSNDYDEEGVFSGSSVKLSTERLLCFTLKTIKSSSTVSD